MFYKNYLKQLKECFLNIDFILKIAKENITHLIKKKLINNQFLSQIAYYSKNFD